MANDTIKARAIPAGGYQYQIDAGLLLLADWLDDPGLYKSVIFECEDPSVGMGLDDIVAECGMDGSLHLTQVKLTVDSEDQDYALTWDWLLSAARGTSLLQKWNAALKQTGSARVSKASLFTNRKPDREFEAALSPEKKIVLSSLAPAVRQQIDAQLPWGDIDAFFALFQFDHSKQNYDAIGRSLVDRFVPTHASVQGYHALRVVAQDWAIRKKFPPPDGRITLEILRSVLSAARPAPLHQDFRIPKSYEPPDPTFLQMIHKRVTSGTDSVLVLSGSPGQGKSTFLSFYCSQLAKQSIPYIRHHYFLSLGDTSDRFSLHEVANSLMAQMEANHFQFVQNLPAGAERLREWIEACAVGYAKENKPFVVVIDGLDHVWRENARDKRLLDSLFRHLLPPMQNVVLLLGSQPVPDEQLPSLLHLHADDSKWIELPRMSLVVVGRWLAKQLAAGRFELMHDSPQTRADLFRDITEAFHQVTSGHPLHLTYTFEHLSTEKRRLLPDDVFSCDPCPSGDIRKYYRTLWNRLSFAGKDALHLATAADFIWPENGLGQCTGLSGSEIRREIGFLFQNSEVGILPFHGSLLVFISELPEHSARVADLLPRVADWLENAASAYLRWAWLWIIKAKTGLSKDLRENPNRQWMLDSLALGYPVEQVQRILRGAAESCFTSLKLTRAVELRLLMDRLDYGSKHQFDSVDRMSRCTFELNDDKYALATLAANLSTLSIQELYVIGQQYISLRRYTDAEDCQEEIRLRINERIQLGAMKDDLYLQSSMAYLDLAASTLNYNSAGMISQLRRRERRSPGLFEYFLRRLARKKDPLRFLAFSTHPMPITMRYAVEGAAIRAAAYAQAAIDHDGRFNRLNRHPIVGVWCALRGIATPKLRIGKFRVPPRNTEYRLFFDHVRAFFAHYFFCVLFESLKVQGNDPLLENPDCEARLWVQQGLNTLRDIAIKAAQSIVSGGFPAASIVYRLMPPMSDFPGHEEFQDYKSLRLAMWDITRDLVLLGHLRHQEATIDPGEFAVIKSSKNFAFDDWAESYLSDGMELVKPDLTDEVVRHESKQQLKGFTEFGERAESALLLCDLALCSGLRDTAREMLVRALRCVCGYGHRKDVALAVFMDSLDEVADSDSQFTVNCLRRVAPIIDSIVETTDGKGTRHTRTQLAGFLLRFMRQRFPAYLRHLFREGSWHVTDSVVARLIEFSKGSSDAFPIASFGVFEEESIKELTALVADADPAVASRAQRCLGEVAILLGNRFELDRKAEANESTTLGRSPDVQELDLNLFGPDDVLKLLEYQNDPPKIFHRTEALQQWAMHWAQAARGAEILASLEQAKKHLGLRLDGEKVLDAAFEISLKIEGPQKAYRWLVDSQIMSSGWSEFYSEERAKLRFGFVKKYYLKRWKEFLVDSARTKFQEEDSGPFIPTERLVDFLIVIEEFAPAREIVDVMLASLEEDFADQPLTSQEWLDGEVE
jgi:NACHT domain